MDTELLTKIKILHQENKKYEIYYELMIKLLHLTGCNKGYFGEIVYDQNEPKLFVKILIDDIHKSYDKIRDEYKNGKLISIKKKIIGIPYYTLNEYYVNNINNDNELTISCKNLYSVPLIVENNVIGIIYLCSDNKFDINFSNKYKYFFEHMTYILSTNMIMDEKKILELITNAQRLHISRASKEDIFKNLLDGIIKLTSSEYGFIGEVLYDKDKLPYLKTMAFTDIAWNKELKEKFDKNQGIIFKSLNTLFGIVLTTQNLVISNDTYNDERRGGQSKLPKGHPPLRRFCGLPFFFENKFVGMIGIANSPFDYHVNIHNKLEPFLTTCASLINNIREENNREEIRKINMNFISQISHELKTPLNSIMGFAQLLKLEQPSEFLDHIINGGDKLLDLINSSLNLNRLDKYNMNFTYLSLYKIVTESLQDHELSIKKMNLTIENNLDKNILMYCDKFLLERIVKNLLSNAIKYNIASGKIYISQKFKNERLYISIKNTGKMNLNAGEIFMPFCTTDRDGGGTGLGLSITRKIFDILDEEIICDYDDDYVEFCFSMKFKKSNTKKILYIEDNLMNQLLMKNILKGYDFTILKDANDILSYINDYDILLLDLYLENNVSGFDIIKLLREHNIVIPIIVITADTNNMTSKKIINMGIKLFNKPIPINEFRGYIHDTFFIEE